MCFVNSVINVINSVKKKKKKKKKIKHLDSHSLLSRNKAKDSCTKSHPLNTGDHSQANYTFVRLELLHFAV